VINVDIQTCKNTSLFKNLVITKTIINYIFLLCNFFFSVIIKIQLIRPFSASLRFNLDSIIWNFHFFVVTINLFHSWFKLSIITKLSFVYWITSLATPILYLSWFLLHSDSHFFYLLVYLIFCWQEIILVHFNSNLNINEIKFSTTNNISNQSNICLFATGYIDNNEQNIQADSSSIITPKTSLTTNIFDINLRINIGYLIFLGYNTGTDGSNLLYIAEVNTDSFPSSYWSIKNRIKSDKGI
jgi:hypothetical protein